MEEVEKAFSGTALLLFGSRLGPIDDYGSWLNEYVRQARKEKSAVSDKLVSVPLFPFYNSIKAGLVKHDEALELGKKSISAADAERLSLKNAKQLLAGISYFTPEAIVGENTCVEDAGAYGLSHYCARGEFFNTAKYAAYCFWPRESEHVFGCDEVFSCSFCINCYNSSELTRCFEISDSSHLSDCYFCHNCENLGSCMFCFNLKAKRYAIANVEVGREKYLSAKKLLAAEIAQRLEKDKRLGISIFRF